MSYTPVSTIRLELYQVNLQLATIHLSLVRNGGCFLLTPSLGVGPLARRMHQVAITRLHISYTTRQRIADCQSVVSSLAARVAELAMVSEDDIQSREGTRTLRQRPYRAYVAEDSISHIAV